jgi:hypothetical protein
MAACLSFCFSFLCLVCLFGGGLGWKEIFSTCFAVGHVIVKVQSLTQGFKCKILAMRQCLLILLLGEDIGFGA